MNKLVKIRPVSLTRTPRTPRTFGQLAKDTKGATMVEYALMLFLILVVAALAVRALGTKVTTAVGSASTAFGN